MPRPSSAWGQRSGIARLIGRDQAGGRSSAIAGRATAGPSRGAGRRRETQPSTREARSTRHEHRGSRLEEEVSSDDGGCRQFIAPVLSTATRSGDHGASPCLAPKHRIPGMTSQVAGRAPRRARAVAARLIAHRSPKNRLWGCRAVDTESAHPSGSISITVCSGRVVGAAASGRPWSGSNPVKETDGAAQTDACGRRSTGGQGRPPLRVLKSCRNIPVVKTADHGCSVFGPGLPRSSSL